MFASPTPLLYNATLGFSLIHDGITIFYDVIEEKRLNLSICALSRKHRDTERYAFVLHMMSEVR